MGPHGGKRLDTVHLGHFQVHQHHIGRELGGHLHRLTPAGRFADNVEVGLCAKDGDQPVAKDRMVIDDQDAYRFAHGPSLTKSTLRNNACAIALRIETSRLRRRSCSVSVSAALRLDIGTLVVSHMLPRLEGRAGQAPPAATGAGRMPLLWRQLPSYSYDHDAPKMRIDRLEGDRELQLPRLNISLTMRFGITALLVIGVLGYVLSTLLGDLLTHNGLESAEAEVRDTLARRVLGQLSPQDLAVPMAGQRLAEFQDFVDTSIVSERTGRIRIWNRDGLIVYADDPDEIGRTILIQDDRAKAVAGETASEILLSSEAESAADAGDEEFLQVYTPIVFSGSEEVAGAFEIHQSYEPIADQIAATRRYVLFGLGIGLFVLYVALLGIVHNGSRTIIVQQRELERAVDRERQRAMTDPLTGLANHRGALSKLEQAFAECRDDDQPLALVIGDVDGLKRLNDTYGHVRGDEMLKRVAGIFQRACGPDDIASRYGGDEFLLILPRKTRAEAIALAEKIAREVDDAAFSAKAGKRVPISISLGAASAPEDADSIGKLVTTADAAMYAAKLGRDRAGGGKGNVGNPSDGDARFGALDGLVQAIDAKDHYTKRHSDLVAEYASKLAGALHLSPEVRRAMMIAGLLHDVGKLVVPDEILKKPAPLTSSEYDAMTRHVVVGEVLLNELPQLKDVVDAVSCHHERYDGSGYPRGLRGEEIPLVGRIIAIADAHSAMTLDRPYRKAISGEQVMAELAEGSGSQFDPELLTLFVELLKEEASHPKAA